MQQVDSENQIEPHSHSVDNAAQEDNHQTPTTDEEEARADIFKLGDTEGLTMEGEKGSYNKTSEDITESTKGSKRGKNRYQIYQN